MQTIKSEVKDIVNVDIVLSPAEEEEILRYASSNIQGDRNALLSWGINQMLSNTCGEMFVSRKLGCTLSSVPDLDGDID